VRFFAKSPKVGQDPAYEVLTADEVERMLSAAKVRSGRDHAMLATMAALGLRRAEVVGAKIGDFKEAGEGHILCASSARATRYAPSPSPPTFGASSNATSQSGRTFSSRADARKPLFPSREGGGAKPLTTRAVRYIVKKYARAVGITKPISPHSIRHSVGTNMAMNEAPLLVIQQFLGHSDPKTTFRYVRAPKSSQTKLIRIIHCDRMIIGGGGWEPAGGTDNRSDLAKLFELMRAICMR
jgi:site-specific recombinase XerD